MKRHTSKNPFIIAGAIIIAIIGYFWYSSARYNYVITTPVDPTNPAQISFIIKKGDVITNISKNLQEKNLILDEDIFKSYAKNQGIDRKIIAGRFMLNKTMTIPEIAEKITNPNQGQLILTVQEGSTVQDIDAKLVDLGAAQPGEFIQATKDFTNYSKYPFLDEQKIKKLPHPLEGYLFPDTYFIEPTHFSAQDLIDLMLKDFQKRLPEELLTNKGANLTGTPNAEKKFISLYDIITMSSILEEEVNTNKDRAVVAGILWKRLEQNWFLGADATLLYLKKDRTIDAQDLQENSPYNTRKNHGLPTGPISNPGLKSIEAAANPESSKYFFYLTTPDTGEVIYAQTNDEHNANKAKYLN